jgi:hypothetical protein
MTTLVDVIVIRGRIQKLPDWVDNEMITVNTHWEATQRIMAAKLTRLTHKIAIQLHLVAESCIICSSRSSQPVRKLLDTPSYPISCSHLLCLLTYLHTYLLHGAEYYLKSWLSLSLSKNILLSLRKPEVHHRVHKSPPMDPILSQLNSVRPIDPYLPKVHLNVILSPTARSSQWSLRASQPKPCEHLSPPQCVPHVQPTSSSLI